jgi:hypothetical protein
VHKALPKVSPAGIKQIAAVVTFGDPNKQFDNTPIPAGIPSSSVQSVCLTGSVPDTLCANLPGDFKIPTSISDITAPFQRIVKVASGVQQVEAAELLIKAFPGQLMGSFSAFIKALRPSQFMRLTLSPEHFTYGNNGMAKAAAEKVAALTAIKNAKLTTVKSTWLHVANLYYSSEGDFGWKEVFGWYGFMVSGVEKLCIVFWIISSLGD